MLFNEMTPACGMLYEIHHEDYAPSPQEISIAERLYTFCGHRGLGK